MLRESFARSHSLTQRRKEALAAASSLTSRQVEIWFQNRRARLRSKASAERCAALEAELARLREENRAIRESAVACACALETVQQAALGALAAARQETATAQAVLLRQLVAGAGGGTALPPALPPLQLPPLPQQLPQLRFA